MKNINILYLIGIAVLLVLVAPSLFRVFVGVDVVSQDRPSAVDGFICFTNSAFVDSHGDVEYPGISYSTFAYADDKPPFQKYFYVTYDYNCKVNGGSSEATGIVNMAKNRGYGYMVFANNCPWDKGDAEATISNLKGCYAPSIDNAKMYYEQTFNPIQAPTSASAPLTFWNNITIWFANLWNSMFR